MPGGVPVETGLAGRFEADPGVGAGADDLRAAGAAEARRGAAFMPVLRFPAAGTARFRAEVDDFRADAVGFAAGRRVVFLVFLVFADRDTDRVADRLPLFVDRPDVVVRDLAAAGLRVFAADFLAFGRLALTAPRFVAVIDFLAVLLVFLRAVERLAVRLAAMTLPLSEVDPSL